MTDQLDRAVAAIDAEAVAPDPVAVLLGLVGALAGRGYRFDQIKIEATGRDVLFAIPPDLSPAEIVELAGYLTTQTYVAAERVRASRNPESRLVLPRGAHV